VAKLRVGLLFGGRSVEHEVSIASATSILKALDPARYDVTLIAVDHGGRWHAGSPSLPPEAAVRADEVMLPAIPGEGSLISTPKSVSDRTLPLDVIFPIIHGTGGEDGSLQGLLELAGVPYVGAGVLGSAMQMDKDVTKRLLEAAGLPVVPGRVLRSADAARRDGFPEIVSALGLPLFVKPADLGSSVGVTKVKRAEDLASAVRDAFRYTRKVLVEQAVDAREIEVAVLGGERPEASVPGEIVPKREWYDYEAKYVDDDTELLVPAPLPEATAAEARRLALEAFRVVEGEGLARVDFFLDRKTGRLYVNEVNSLPGFTEVSMFPRLWIASGLSYPGLIDRLIELALERSHIRGGLETTFRMPVSPHEAENT
jgi:D-alanine-D-alanine ligase